MPTSGSSLGAPGTEQVTRLVVARWPRARIVRGGVDARGRARDAAACSPASRKDGATLELLDEHGDVGPHASARGDGAGLVVALQPRADELVWLVTALDEQGLDGRRAGAATRTSCATRSRWP